MSAKFNNWFYYLCIFFWFLEKFINDLLLNIIESICSCCFKYRKFAQLPDSLIGKTVVITGANAGIGRETAKACARLGAKVIFACRNINKAKGVIEEIVNESVVKTENLICVHLDLSSLQSVRNCALEIADNCECIDVLVNNGGIMMCPKWTTKDGFDWQFGTNYLGHFLLTTLLLPKLKSAPSARIVYVASLASFIGHIHFNNLNLNGFFAYNSLKAYAQSKLAQLLTVYELTKRLKDTSHITVYALHPGVVNTGITEHFPWILNRIAWLFNKLVMISPEMGAQTTLHCAFSEEAGKESGLYYENCKPQKVPPHTLDDATSAQLWDLSLKLCNIDDNNNVI